MGRSVAVPTDAEITYYFPFEANEDDLFLWDELVESIRESLPSSYWTTDKWIGSEIRVIAENYHCGVTISEYCGLVALSICINPEYENLAFKTLEATKKALEPFSEYRKIGRFSNGNAIYEPIKQEAEIK